MNLYQEHHFEREIWAQLAMNGWLYAEDDAARFDRGSGFFLLRPAVDDGARPLQPAERRSVRSRVAARRPADGPAAGHIDVACQHRDVEVARQRQHRRPPGIRDRVRKDHDAHRRISVQPTSA